MKSVHHTDCNQVPRYGRTAGADSQSGWRCRLPQQKDLCHPTAIQCGPDGKFLCLKPNNWKEEGRGKASTNFLCEL